LSIDENDYQKDENGEAISRYLKLEASWILTNIGYGDENVLNYVFDPRYQIFNHLNNILQSDDL